MNSWLRHSVIVIACALAALPAGAQSLLVRQGEITASTLTNVTSAALDTGRLVTAKRNGAGSLEVTTYDLVPGGTFTLLDTVTSTAIKDMSVTALSKTRFVTGTRQSDDSLLLTSWAVDSLGNITKLKTAAAGAILQIEVAALNPSRLVTITRGSTHIPKVIQWSVDGAGNFTRGTDFTDTAVAVADVSVTALSATRIVTAYRQTPSLTLLLTTWDVPVIGAVAKRDTISGITVTQSQIVTTASDRVVTAARRSTNGNLQLAAWDVDAAGNLVNSSNFESTPVVSLSLAPLGTTRVATVTRQPTTDAIKVTAWQVVDQIHMLDSLTGGGILLPNAVNLGMDRLVTPVILPDSTLKVIAWREASIGMLHISTGPFGSAITAGLTAAGSRSKEAAEPAAEAEENEAEEAREAAMVKAVSRRPISGGNKNVGAFDLIDANQTPTSPAPNLVFQPGIEGVDPMIAVGNQFMLVSQQGMVGFFDKSGNLLPTKWGGPTVVWTSQLFSPFWQPTLGGAVNRNNINLHLRFPLSTNPEMQCDATAASPSKPCVQEMYDTRVAFDRTNNRFVIVAAVRHSIWMGDMASDGTLLDPIVRRYFVVGVSRTEDPRDGFNAYINTETNYSDWPRVGLGNGVLIVAHAAAKSATDWKPMAYVFALSDMALGATEPRNWKIDPFQTNGGNLIPVTHLSANSGWNHMIHPNGATWDVFSFQNSASTFSALPPLRKTSVSITAALNGFTEGVVFRNGKLHVAGVTVKANRVVDASPEQDSLRLLRIPILSDANGFPLASRLASDGFLDFDYGVLAASDTVNWKFSYEQPSVAVNVNGDILVSFGRVPVNNLTPQEARYFIFRNATNNFEGSRLLKAGTSLLTTTYTDATTFTAVPYYHFGDDNYKDYIDFANAVVDPADDTTFWMTHEFSNGTNFIMTVGRVVP
jgi:hypothetical protein